MAGEIGKKGLLNKEGELTKQSREILITSSLYKSETHFQL